MMGGWSKCPSQFVVLFVGVLLLVGGCRGVDRPDAGTQISCAQPAPEMAAACAEMEAQILQATVRVEILRWVVLEGERGYDLDRSLGHATVMEGEWLVTHNHASVLEADRPGKCPLDAYCQLVLSRADGEPFFRCPLSDFEVVWESEDELVLAYKEAGLFTAAQIRPAAFVDWHMVPLQPGREVAQVDWDRDQARVDWTTITSVKVGDGAARLLLADGVTLGASGGGVFWQGGHIGINRCQVQEYDAVGELIDCHTGVALDPAALLYR